jgi:hypothetical protein
VLAHLASQCGSAGIIRIQNREVSDLLIHENAPFAEM